jgi:hypothetical protein
MPHCSGTDSSCSSSSASYSSSCSVDHVLLLVRESSTAKYTHVRIYYSDSRAALCSTLSFVLKSSIKCSVPYTTNNQMQATDRHLLLHQCITVTEVAITKVTVTFTSTLVALSPFLYSRGQSSRSTRGLAMCLLILACVTSLLNITPFSTLHCSSSPVNRFALCACKASSARRKSTYFSALNSAGSSKARF